MRLGLGTVQFGMDYGISNKTGKVAAGSVHEILELARRADIDLLDTAPSYGDSEAVLGAQLGSRSDFRIVSKTPVFEASAITPREAGLLIEACERSLQRLRQPALYGLLVHRVDDLLSAGGGYLVDAMRELQRRKRVEKIGVTVYTGEQIDAILKLFVPDIVQLPVSVLDQRLVRSGHLAQLGSRGVEIHARSVFLQGLLLMDPGSASAHFEPFRPALRKVRAHAAATQVSPLQLALGFVKSLSHIAIAIVGTSSAADLGEIVDAWQAAAGPRFDCGELACEDERLVNPALWIH